MKNYYEDLHKLENEKIEKSKKQIWFAETEQSENIQESNRSINLNAFE